MNDKLHDIARQAAEWAKKESTSPWSRPYGELYDEKFAELIVRECAEITSGLSKLYPRTDVAFDVGYTMGTTRATKEIEQHFGLDE